VVVGGSQRDNTSMKVLTSRVLELENVKGVDNLHIFWAY
jgi:hypothetical protein